MEGKLLTAKRDYYLKHSFIQRCSLIKKHQREIQVGNQKDSGTSRSSLYA